MFIIRIGEFTSGEGAGEKREGGSANYGIQICPSYVCGSPNEDERLERIQG